MVWWGNEEGQNLLLLGGEGHGIEELETHSQANSSEADGGDEEDVVNDTTLQVNWLPVIHLELCHLNPQLGVARVHLLGGSAGGGGGQGADEGL